jgi:hypothetical protein
MKKGRGIQIKINFTNRWLYTFIAIGILAIVGVGVYAYGTSNPSTFGHSIGELAAPSGCLAGQFLKYDGTNWVCSASTSQDYCSGGTCNGNLIVNNNLTTRGNIATFGVIKLMTTIRYINEGVNIGSGNINPRCPCDISSTTTDCGQATGSINYTQTDVGPICYDWYVAAAPYGRRWNREIGGPWVMKTYN